MTPRPPVVAILGHVDHGKTTLLDYIRKSTITKREHGGITQRIGGYEAKVPVKGYPVDTITFIDTPGHEVFSSLRARGATVADIALLLIDAKDGIKPQTVESIAHIKSSGIPYIVVLNKEDLPEASPDRVKIDLLKHEVMVEDKGGKVPALSLSAKTGRGVDELLETILLVASELNLMYDPKAPPQIYVIETKKDRRGVVASCIIKNGSIAVADTIFDGQTSIKVRSLWDDRGEQIRTALPSTPFELLGLTQLPEVGAMLTSSRVAKASPAQVDHTPAAITMEALLDMGDEKTLPIIIKADSQGSLEAIDAILRKNSGVKIVSTAVGPITKSDIFLAKTTKSIIIGFNTKEEPEANTIAKQEKVVIKTYNIIYELLDDVSEVASLIREKQEREKNLKGEAKVLATFIIAQEKVFGVRVTKGKAALGDTVEVYHEGKQTGTGKLTSLKLRAKTVPEVKKDQEAGMGFEPALDISVNDMVKFVL